MSNHISETEYAQLIDSEKAGYREQEQCFSPTVGWVNKENVPNLITLLMQTRLVYIPINSTSEGELLPISKQTFANKKDREGAIYKAIGDNITALRKSKDITQEILGEQLGVTRVSVVNIENGKQRLPIHLLNPIAEILGVTLVEIIKGVFPINPSVVHPTPDREPEEKSIRELASESPSMQRNGYYSDSEKSAYLYGAECGAKLTLNAVRGIIEAEIAITKECISDANALVGLNRIRDEINKL